MDANKLSSICEAGQLRAGPFLGAVQAAHAKSVRKILGAAARGDDQEIRRVCRDLGMWVGIQLYRDCRPDIDPENVGDDLYGHGIEQVLGETHMADVTVPTPKKDTVIALGGPTDAPYDGP